MDMMERERKNNILVAGVTDKPPELLMQFWQDNFSLACQLAI